MDNPELRYWSDGPRVESRGPGFVWPVRGWVFYVWKPDIAKAWPLLLEDEKRKLIDDRLLAQVRARSH